MTDPFKPGVLAKKQHTRPCGDCPWTRTSAPGWLGGETPEQWVQIAHGESRVDCHVIINQQCAGIATYRANVAKACRDPSILRLPKDTQNVFAAPQEFLNHHSRSTIVEDDKKQTEKQKRGFAVMEPERRRQIASQGGKTAHANGVAHQFTPEEAREAGRKGGRNRVGTNKDAEPGGPADPARTPTE